MKGYKNKLFASILAIAMLFVFSSCEGYDYKWRDATMDMSAVITASPNGTIRADLPIGYDWVVANGRYNRIDDITYYGGRIEIITNGNYIDNLYLTLSNSNAVLNIAWKDRRSGTIYDDDPYVDDFLYAITEVVRRYGYATIYVNGYSDRSARFELNFMIDINAYVQY
jgi:hypothetical protein